MNIDLITTVLESPSKDKVRALLDDDTTVFWVDWREDESDIVRFCEVVLQTGSLVAEWRRSATQRGGDLFIIYREKQFRAPLINGQEDRHIALCALNQALAPDYEIRFCVDSNGSDTLAFLPLPLAKWLWLEERTALQ